MSIWTTAARFAVNFRSRNEGKLVFTLSAEARLLTFAECDRFSMVFHNLVLFSFIIEPCWTMINWTMTEAFLPGTRMTHWLSLQHWCREGSALVWPGSLGPWVGTCGHWVFICFILHDLNILHPSILDHPRPTGYDHYGKDIKRRSNRWSFVPALRRSCTKHLRPWLGPTCPEHKAWQTNQSRELQPGFTQSLSITVT